MGMMYDGLTSTVFSGGQKPAPTGNSVIACRGVVTTSGSPFRGGSRREKRCASRKSTDLCLLGSHLFSESPKTPLNKAGFKMNA
jgi:hypothetical protein